MKKKERGRERERENVQMGADGLLRGHVVDVRARDAETAVFLWSAARTPAVCLYGGKVGGE